MDQVECAARILVRAFGYGRAWDTRHTHGEDRWEPATEVTVELSLGGQIEEDEPSAASDGLPVCRETETLQRAGESVSAWMGRHDAQTLTREQCRARAKLTPEQKKSLWAWELANPLHKGQQHNPRRPREFEHWKRTRSGPGVQVVRPLHTMDQCAIEALVGIPKPLQSTLLIYALQDGRYWPTVERYACASLPHAAHAGVPEGMFRLLTDPSKRLRAKELRMRETEWDAMSCPALRLFESWIERAANTFLQQLDKAAPVAGTQGNGHLSETWWRPVDQCADVRGGSPASSRA
jgi:hypothetical protein